MSRELQEKAERIMRELKDSLAPIKKELELLKNVPENRNTRIFR